MKSIISSQTEGDVINPGKHGKLPRFFERLGKQQTRAVSGFEVIFPEFPEFLKQEGGIIFFIYPTGAG